MLKVTHGKIKFEGVYYGKNEKAGDIISGLSTKQEKSLADKGYGEVIKSTGENGKKKHPFPDISQMNVNEVGEIIDKINDKETLYKMLEYEENNKNRATVIRPLESKIVDLEEAEDNGDTNIDLHLDPEEAIKD